MTCNDGSAKRPRAGTVVAHVFTQERRDERARGVRGKQWTASKRAFFLNGTPFTILSAILMKSDIFVVFSCYGCKLSAKPSDYVTQ